MGHAVRLVGAPAPPARCLIPVALVRQAAAAAPRPPVARPGTAPRRRAGAAPDGRPACRAARRSIRFQNGETSVADRRVPQPPGPVAPGCTPRRTVIARNLRGTHHPVGSQVDVRREAAAAVGPRAVGTHRPDLLPSSSWTVTCSRASRSSRSTTDARGLVRPVSHRATTDCDTSRIAASPRWDTSRIRLIRRTMPGDPAVERTHEPVVPLGLRPVRHAVPGRPVDLRRTVLPAPRPRDSPDPRPHLSYRHPRSGTSYSQHTHGHPQRSALVHSRGPGPGHEVTCGRFVAPSRPPGQAVPARRLLPPSLAGESLRDSRATAGGSRAGQATRTLSR